MVLLQGGPDSPPICSGELTIGHGTKVNRINIEEEKEQLIVEHNTEHAGVSWKGEVTEQGNEEVGGTSGGVGTELIPGWFEEYLQELEEIHVNEGDLGLGYTGNQVNQEVNVETIKVGNIETGMGFGKEMDSEGSLELFSDDDYEQIDESTDDDDAIFQKNVEQDEGIQFISNKTKEDFDISSDDDHMDFDEDDFDEHRVSDEDDEASTNPVFNPALIFDPTLELKMLFGTKSEFRRAIQSHAIRTKRTLKTIKNDKNRVYVTCVGDGCEWRVNALKKKGEDSFQINHYNSHHSCPQTFHVKNLKANWLSEKYIERFKTDPKRQLKGFRHDVINEIRCNVSKHQIYRAKQKVLKMLEGSPDAQFSKLWSYVEELRKSNPGSTVILGTENLEGRFDRLYICFDAFKKGFKAGCRPIIGVDGCHLKGPYKGVLLTAVGIDPNNCLYPIAYAVVCKENTETWQWFLTVLKMDLNLYRTHEYTFMSDKQKGLIQAFQEVFADSEHRFCVRHLHNNFKNAGFRGLALKNALWRAARASTTSEFNQRMKEMRDLSEEAYNWFHDKPPNQWSRSHFNEHSRCDMLLNNICESFNSMILDARDKLIITMSEWIREFLTIRLQENRDKAEAKWKGKLCPKIQKILEKHKEQVGDCIPVKSDDWHYQINCFDGSQYVVDLEKWTCACRMWGLSGIPCKHACRVIFNQNLLPEDFVHPCYTVDTYKAVYQYPIMGINGQQLWGESMIIPPLPPNFGRGVGRPSKTRRRESDEVINKQKKRSRGKQPMPVRMKRQQCRTKCRKCGQSGHNARKCGKDDSGGLTKQSKKKQKVYQTGPGECQNVQSIIHDNNTEIQFLLPPDSNWLDLNQEEVVQDGWSQPSTAISSIQISQVPHVHAPSMLQQFQISNNNYTHPVSQSVCIMERWEQFKEISTQQSQVTEKSKKGKKTTN